MDKRKIVLIGKSCSGKSTIAQKLEVFGFKGQLSTTTRPMRDYETQGVDYNFVSDECFNAMKADGQFIETDNFNGWQYGLTHKNFKDASVLILTPRGLHKYLELLPRENFLIIYVETSIKLRNTRMMNRGDLHDDVNRRWVADDIDFENWENWGMPWDIKLSLQTEDVIPTLINIFNLNIKTK